MDGWMLNHITLQGLNPVGNWAEVLVSRPWQTGMTCWQRTFVVQYVLL